MDKGSTPPQHPLEVPGLKKIPDPRRDALDVLTADYVQKCEEIGCKVHLMASSYQAADGKSYYRTRNFSDSTQLLEILFAFILALTPFDFEAMKVALDTHPAFSKLRMAVEHIRHTPPGRLN